MKAKYLFSILMGKLTYVGMRLAGKKVPYFPGYIARKFCKNFLSMVEKPKLTIAVTGTNGKSTICGILEDFFEKQGYRVINNKGFNIETGIISMFLKNMNLFGKLKADVAIMEIDEATTVHIFKHIEPDYYICTNLFRDSMHDNSNVDNIANKIKFSMPKHAKLILNADDLLTVSLANSNAIYFGISEQIKGNTKHIFSDLVYCPKCMSKLEFKDTKYFHIGNVSCPNCGYTNPKRDYDASIKENEIIIKHKKDVLKYPLKVSSIFNIYNYIASIALFKELGYSDEVITSYLNDMRLIETRYSEEMIGNIKLINHLAKGQNPVACSSVFEYAVKSNKDKAILLMLDDVTDRRESSETIAWYYDTDFELFKNSKVKKIIISGARGYDVYVRLLFAGIDSKKMVVTEEAKMASYIPFKDIKEIYLLHDITLYDQSLEVLKDIRKAGGKNEN